VAGCSDKRDPTYVLGRSDTETTRRRSKRSYSSPPCATPAEQGRDYDRNVRAGPRQWQRRRGDAWRGHGRTNRSRPGIVTHPAVLSTALVGGFILMHPADPYIRAHLSGRRRGPCDTEAGAERCRWLSLNASGASTRSMAEPRAGPGARARVRCAELGPPQLGGLTPQYSVIVYDARGHGLSVRPAASRRSRTRILSGVRPRHRRSESASNQVCGVSALPVDRQVVARLRWLSHHPRRH